MWKFFSGMVNHVTYPPCGSYNFSSRRLCSSIRWALSFSSHFYVGCKDLKCSIDKISALWEKLSLLESEGRHYEVKVGESQCHGWHNYHWRNCVKNLALIPFWVILDLSIVKSGDHINKIFYPAKWLIVMRLLVFIDH